MTLHKVAAGFDTGDILLQEAFPVTQRDTLETLTETIRTVAPRLAAACAAGLDRLWASAVPQGAGEYWPEPGEEEMVITPEDSARRADRVARAFAGYGFVYRGGGEEQRILRGEVRFASHTTRPGTMRVEGGVPMYALRGGWLRIFQWA